MNAFVASRRSIRAFLRRKIASQLGNNRKEGVTAAVTGKTYEYETRYKLPPLLPPTNDSNMKSRGLRNPFEVLHFRNQICSFHMLNIVNGRGTISLWPGRPDHSEMVVASRADAMRDSFVRCARQKKTKWRKMKKIW